METIFERVAGLDVHKAQVTACVRVPEAGGAQQEQLAEFATTVRGLIALRDWLEAHKVTHVAMEATGVYWQPVWHVLEDTCELYLVNARHVKQVPGARPMSPTRPGSRASWRPGSCGGASCPPGLSVPCA